MAAADSQALTRAYRPTSNLSKSTRLNVPQFLQKLYEMVNEPGNNDLIRWSDTGDFFIVLDHERFAREVLGRWFKHQNFQSFVRQLNMYGFHKIPSLQQGVLKSDSDTEVWNFEHPHFRQGQPDLLCLISRKKQASQHATTSGTVLDLNTIVTGIQAIKRHQQTISADLNELKSSNQSLWQEALAARERHNKQQDMINRILKFLASVFGRHEGQNGKDHHHDGVSPSPPLVRTQRLMIGAPDRQKKGVEVIEVDDDERSHSPMSTRSDECSGLLPSSLTCYTRFHY
ncbi:hypothetical protein K488DRAFT_44108 [Vararia minispora EC-137]|uniref:Uncharacterized protein n=1 Tax=Vararia minispora EC-137 TaxID=1314806 RepID=A0ACB8QU65_9AGAM|nr:hypothetical protein K488DRAFT_44108 [Vararia minispora EC-137]